MILLFMRELILRLSLPLMFVAMIFVACSDEQLPDTPSQEEEPEKEEPTPVPPPEPEADFVIEIEELTGTNCITKVTPLDKDVYYVMYKSDIQYFYDCQIDTDEALFEDDMFYFKRGAEYDGITLQEYMQQWQVLFSDVTRVNWTNLRPANREVVYVYGIEFNEDFTDCTRVTDVFWVLIDPPLAELGDAQFDVTYAVDGAEVELSVKPRDWDGLYTVQFFNANEDLYYDASQDVTDDYVRSVAEGWISMFGNNLDGGVSVEDILAFTCERGEQRLSYELDSYTLYTVLVYAVEEVDGFYQMVSRPQVINFSTEEVQPSDMTIDITLDNLYVRICDLRITPSVDDENYVMLISPMSYIKRDYTDEDLIEAALDTYVSFAYIFRGEMTARINTLYPETEYIVITFGYSGGVVTTPVFKRVFTTQAEGECELAITNVNYGGPYLPSELKALDPERFGNLADGFDDYMFAIWMEVVTDTPTPDIFTYFVDTDTFNYYGEETIFYDLLIDTCDPVEVTYAEYFMDYYICAAAYDYKGDVTPMWRSEALTFKASDARPAEELIAKLDASQQAKVMFVRSAANR